MNAVALNGFTAATAILRLLRTAFPSGLPDVIDLDLVRQGLPGTPYGKGVREIKAPMPSPIASCEGMLVRNPNDAAEWGIFYNGNASPERQRFTIAHELGHFILHRDRQMSFQCDKASVYSGQDTLAVIEREADDFASNLLLPGDVLRDAMAGQTISLHLLSQLASRFQVSFEALCIRFIKYTDVRAILLHWDNGFLKYEWRSRSAVLSKARIQRLTNPVEPLPGTIAADTSVLQERDGVELPASLWCTDEAPYMKLHEFKHTYAARDRVLTLLLLEDAEPRRWNVAGTR
ncbi:ImmA/IrrE family metallo-endopeptidase [Burkholderia sp. AU28942]|uniref:ImmA/IrrE family metallo-endopeptidase n=1 Tax=Burkholderia TaxID=32008 RepID=UPI0009F6D43A|nr:MULTISPECIES: ImmA/IrrE family metallo-endopeptidase [Burkholderia]MCA8312073.1 ImmA/IrrE family metallo-endopeptidase [Burkholderia sp. AU28942]